MQSQVVGNDGRAAALSVAQRSRPNGDVQACAGMNHDTRFEITVNVHARILGETAVMGRKYGFINCSRYQ